MMSQSDNPYEQPAGSANVTAVANNSYKMTLKRIDVMSAGLVMGTLYAIMGLIIGGFVSLFSIVGGVAASAGGDQAFGTVIFGIASILILPVLYGIGGLIGGVIAALLYNFVASLSGGLKFELES